MSDVKPNLIRAADIRRQEESARHTMHRTSQLIGTHLSPLTGLSRTGVSIVRIPPGKESFAYHAHHGEEEWIYILAGTGIALIDDKEYNVSEGDFMGFPAPSVAHHLRNDSSKDLVYLMGGESREIEIADFPHHGKRMVRTGNEVQVFDLADGRSFAEIKDHESTE